MMTKKTTVVAALAAFLLSGSLIRAEGVPLAALLENLKSPDEAVRLHTIDELGLQGEKAAGAVAPLTALLGDNSVMVRAHAARALGEIGAPAASAVPALAELVKDPDHLVRRQAVKAIMKLHPGPQVMVPLCVRLLEDSDPGTRLRVLGMIAEVGPRAVPGLVEALKNDRAAYWACLALRDIGPDAKGAVPALVERLQDSRPEIRREVLLTLAAINEAAGVAVPQIVALLRDEETRVAATYALGRIGGVPAEAKDAIRANTKSDDKMLGTISLWTLARLHPEDKQLYREAIECLVNRLKDEDPFVRVMAARGLASLPPDPKISDPIWQKALQGADETTVHHALDALATLGAPAVPRLIDVLEQGKAREQIVYILGRIGPDAAPATPSLAKLVADKNEQLAHEAILALANIGPGAKDAVPALVQALQHNENETSTGIAYALGRIGPDASSATPVLMALLDSPDKTLALACAWAITQIQSNPTKAVPKILPVLVAGLSGESPMVRRAAAEGLGTLGPAAGKALPALKKLADDPDDDVQDAAAAAIERIQSDRQK